jgi:drug/metabolite transporter (DMT)-like permease
LVGATVCFAGIDASAKWLNQSMAAAQVVVIRYLGSFVIVILLLNPWTKRGILRTRRPALQATRGLGLVLASVCLFTALRELPLTLVTSITFSAPLIVATLAGPVLGERLGPRRWAAIVVGFCGVVVVTRPWRASFHPAIGLAVLCACVTGVYTLITRKLASSDPPETTLFYTAVVGAVAVAPLAPFVWTQPSSLAVWLVIAFLSVCGALGHWLLILAHKRAPASVVTPFFYTQLLWATLISIFVFAELPDRLTIIGGSIVMSSGLYLLYRERVRHRSPSADLDV